MSMNSVQLYIKSVINGIALPTTPGTDLTVWIAPPAVNPDAGAGAQAFVWGADGDAKRKTMGQRGTLINGSFRGAVHELDVWLTWYQDLTQDNVDSEFPACCDTVRYTIERSPYQVPSLLDTTTGYVSDVYDIGDTNNWQYGSWKAVAPQSSLVACSWRLRLTVKEWYLM